jgi:Ca-activated chloride channel family protein
MRFAVPYYLWLLVAIPPAMIAFFWWSGQARQKLMTQFIQARLLAGLIAGVSSTRQKIRAAGSILAVICLVLALARPQWGFEWEEIKQRGLDIVVAIDTSKSMLAEDIAPNRLARAKLAALDLMQQAKSDRLGLVAFAGSAFLQCPITVDDSAFRQSVEALDVNTIPDGGTALADAIEAAQNAFKEGDNYKVLVLFTDGEDHDSGALGTVRKAADDGLRIFTVGIGSVEGELLRVKGANRQTDFIRDENGNVVKSRLNEALLQQIAGVASGFYLPLRGANAIDTLYQKGLAPLPKTESREKLVKRYYERYHWPLALALVLLVAEMLLPERKRQKGESEVRRSGVSRSEPPEGGTPNKVVPAATVVVALLLVPGVAFGSPSSALRDYRAGRYGEALKEYERSLQKKGKDTDPRLHFNAGAAAYRDQKLDRAAQHLTNALSAPNLTLQEQAYYNLGNTLYQRGERNPDPQGRIGDWESAVKQFGSAIRLNTNDADARFNYEFVKKKLEELKQQQQQENQNQQQQNQQSKQDQESQSQQQNQQQQKQQQSQPQKSEEQEQQQAKQSQEKKDQNQSEQQKARKSAGQEKKEPQPGEQREPAQAYAAGQMTPQEARQLLDSQKNDELLLPVSRKEKASPQQGPLKDW